jgi:hypothetical protein
MESIHEQIAQWLAAALDGQSDPDGIITLRAVRPKILDWTVEDFKHGDCIILADRIKIKGDGYETIETLYGSRSQIGTWWIQVVIRQLPEDISGDAYINKVMEMVQSILLAGNSGGRACNGLALNIDCPEMNFEMCIGGLIAEIIVNIEY